jgi:hypothetical protein
MYKLFKKYEDLILGNNEQRSQEEITESEEGEDEAYRLIMQLSYDCAPKRLYDQNLLKQAKATMSEMQFNREFGAQFVDESDGYFRLSKMAACTIPDGDFPAVEVVGNPSDEYIMAFDPNWAGNTSADHFAMHVFKVMQEDQKICLVHSYAVAGVSLKEHMRYFLYLITHFNIIGICGDYNGGVQFINACNESQMFKTENVNIGVIEIDIEKPESYHADILDFKNQYNVKSKKYCILRKPTVNWIRNANEMLQGAIDHKRILFGSRAVDSHFDDQRKKNLPIDKLKWDMKITSSSKGAKIANIEVTTNPQGSQSFNLPQNIKRQTGPNRARKDSYSALLLGNWFAKIYFDSKHAKASKPPSSSFIPFTI